MTFTDTITKILSSAARPITPQEIREVIKKDHPEFYGTQPHIRNVEKGHFKDIDHALLAQIYSAVRTHKHFFCDSNSKPMKISLRTDEATKRPEGVKLRRRKQSRLSPPVSAPQFEEKIRDILLNTELCFAGR